MARTGTRQAAEETVMEAIVYEEFGGPEVLRLARGDDVHAGPGQIRVAVRAAGVNPVDYKIRNGWMEAAFPTPLPATPGSEFAGVVDETGEGVTGFAVGDEVLGRSATGAYAEYVLADVGAVARKPEGLGWPEAGGRGGRAPRPPAPGAAPAHRVGGGRGGSALRSSALR
ncbi:alcohol dehydrogenase catalytic domain-containing protein, partial [[Kitasatospora] papulosa]|uniref:alcohol dehydrogenase catalytic domain-containing protein n=1 Tax=[Kitasatospora] papulosa TaxID=1464011 RepID=UPI00367CEEA5